MSKIISYVHHNVQVRVDEALKGKHREHCLCWKNCKFFKPEDRDANCPLANIFYNLCVALGVVLPVWECPKYEEKKDYDH